MKLLSLDTSTDACTVAYSDERGIYERFLVAPRQHTAHALPMVEALLAEAGVSKRHLDAIALGIGPGSFTGIRLGAALAQGIALGVGCPILPISSLQAFALGVLQGSALDALLVAQDARMQQLYWGEYAWDGECLQILQNDALSSPEAVVPHQATHYAGSGVDLLGQRTCWPDTWPHAKAIAELAIAQGLATAVAPEAVTLAYLRQRVAEPSKSPKTAS